MTGSPATKSKLEMSIEIGASADHLWNILGNGFGEVAEITTVLNASHLEGPLGTGGTRVCINPQNQRIAEQLTTFDPDTHTLAYDGIDGFPSWVRTAGNHWQIKETGPNSARFTIKPTLTVAWWISPVLPLMLMGVRPILRKFMNEVKYFAEHGTPHPKVVQRRAKLAAKATAQAQRS